MNLRPGDVVMVRIPIHQAQGSKIRPAVVLLDVGDGDFVGAPITCRSRQGEFDMTLADWRFAGLNVPSVARLHKPSVLSKEDIGRVIGRLSDADLGQFHDLLYRAYCVRGG